MIKTGAPPDSSVVYLQSISMYVFFGLAFFLGTLIFFLIFCACRYCCCCCGYGNGCGCCCYSAPSIKNLNAYKVTGDTTCCCGCWGYVRDTDAEGGFAYPAWERWTARILAWISIAVLTGFMIAAAAGGVYAVAPALKSVVKSPASAASMAYGMVTPTANLMTADLNVEVVNTLKTVNKTIYDNVDMPLVRSSLDCIEANLTELTVPTSTAASLTAWNDAYEDAKPYMTTLKDTMDEISVKLGTDIVTPYASWRTVFIGDASLQQAATVNYYPLDQAVDEADTLAAAAQSSSSMSMATFQASIKDWTTQPVGPTNLATGRAGGNAAFRGLIDAQSNLSSYAPPLATAQKWATDFTARATELKPMWETGVPPDFSANNGNSVLNDVLAPIKKAIEAAFALGAVTPASTTQTAFDATLADDLKAALPLTKSVFDTHTDLEALLGTAATAATNLHTALAPVRAAPLIGPDVQAFSTNANAITTCGDDIMTQIVQFNQTLIALGSVVDDAQSTMTNMKNSFNQFDTEIGRASCRERV